MAHSVGPLDAGGRSAVHGARSAWRYTIGRKLATLVGIGVIVAIVLAAVALGGVSSLDSAQKNAAAINNANVELVSMNRYNQAVATQAMVLASVPPKLTSEMSTASTSFRSAITDAQKQVQAVQSAKIPGQLGQQLQAVASEASAYLTQESGAIQQLADNVPGSQQGWNFQTAQLAAAEKVIGDGVNLRVSLQKAATAASAGASSQAGSVRLELIIVAAVGLMAMLAISYLVAISITRPLRRVTGALQGLAKGDFSETLEARGSDEVSEISGAFNIASGSVRSLLAEMDSMSSEHEAGDIDFQIDATHFEGSFRTMAEGVNHMVGSHIDVKKRAMAVFKAFGEGDFSADLELLPGKKRFINDTVSEVRTNLQALVEDSTMLSGSAVEGRLDVRADVTRHKGDFRKIVQGVNDTLDSVIGPLNEVSAVLVGAIEAGDLTRTVNTQYRGQMEDLRQAANNTVARLASTVSEVIGATDQLANAAAQISRASQSLSQASTEQASNVEETSSSLEQMAASINQNSDNSKVTDGIASKAATDASEGGKAVRETVEAMKTIAGKIAIIDDIAFQTNMLALNATIEAARAGEHGKGFAVVATEVGKLAERSQVAAQEISELAAGSVQTAEHAGLLLEQIVPSIGKTSDLVQEIAAASAEQASGAAQISNAMSQMTKITQQNAASSEELAATAEEMAAQTGGLQQVMRFFTVANAGGSIKDPKPSKGVGRAAAATSDSWDSDSAAAAHFDESAFESF